MRHELDLARREKLAVSLQPGHPCRLEQREDPLRHATHDAALALLHLGKVKRRAGDLDAVGREFLLDAVVELARLQQRLGGDAAGVQTRAPEGRRAIAVLPLIDARDSELVLRGADGGRIPRRSPADDDHVEGIGSAGGLLVFVGHD